MAVQRGYLLDTNIVLHATRQGSRFAQSVDALFQLSTSRFRPAICEVTIAELKAFALGWGSARREKLTQVIQGMLVIQVADAGVHERWAELYSHARAKGLPIQQESQRHLDRSGKLRQRPAASLDRSEGVSAATRLALGRCAGARPSDSPPSTLSPLALIWHS